MYHNTVLYSIGQTVYSLTLELKNTGKQRPFLVMHITIII